MEPSEVTFLNTVGSVPAMFVLYDLFYCPFHALLHHPAIYVYVHKHHHKQKSPSRGNRDAINVHPFEFTVGEWIHLLAVSLMPEVHLYAVLFFIVAGGTMASLNHTRFDMRLKYLLLETRFHDEHHVAFNYNFSQYTMLWDHIFGWFRDPELTEKKIQHMD